MPEAKRGIGANSGARACIAITIAHIFRLILLREVLLRNVAFNDI